MYIVVAIGKNLTGVRDYVWVEKTEGGQTFLHKSKESANQAIDQLMLAADEKNDGIQSFQVITIKNTAEKMK